MASCLDNTWLAATKIIIVLSSCANIYIYIYIYMYVYCIIDFLYCSMFILSCFFFIFVHVIWPRPHVEDRFLRSGTLQSESNPFILCYTILPKFTVHNIQCAVMTYPLWAPLEISLPANEEDLLVFNRCVPIYTCIYIYTCMFIVLLIFCIVPCLFCHVFSSYLYM
jgi:hypothetical protein